MIRRHRTVIAVTAAVLFVSAPGFVTSASALPVGFSDLFTSGASDYIILYEGGAGKHLAINNFGTTGIWTGNIGIANNGTLAASGPGTLNGNINFAAANTGQASISNTTINGTVNYGVAGVTTAMNAMNSLASTLGALHSLGTNVAINTSTDQTILTSTGYLDGNGNRVFNVTSFKSGNGENLILKSDGSNNVVFDIGFDTQFHGNILLQDLAGRFFEDPGYAGLFPDQVLFNMYSGAALVGGDTLDANDNGNNAHPANIMYGVFLDPNGKISFVNSRIVGRIFGGDSLDMQIVSGDTITIPPTNERTSGPPVVPEPLTAGTFLLGFLAAASSLARRRRRGL
jgi:hypothetical protein